MRNAIAWIGWLAVMTAQGSDEPVRPAASQPAVRISSGVSLPDDFKPLLSRSIFARKNGGTGKANGAARISASGLALRGVIRDEGGGYTAIIEDLATHQIQKIENGANLGGGTVSHMTLRGFQYDVTGKHTTIAIGQNLAGETAVVAPPLANVAPVAGPKGQNATAPTTADGGEIPLDAAQAAALLAASTNLAEGARPDAVIRAGASRRGPQ